MSVTVVFPNGTDWFKANWVFRQLAQDVTGRNRNDIEFCKVFEVAEALGTLDLKQMNDGQRRRVMEAMESVALDTTSGAIAGWRPNDPKEHTVYCEAISELAKLIEKQRTRSV